MFENLTDKLDSALKSLKGQGRITEVNIATTVKEIRRALVDADVHYNIAKEFTEIIKEKAIGSKVLTAVSPGELMVKIVQDELTRLMGTEKSEINIKGDPAIVLIAGLQGSGKTTFSAKLANMLKTKSGKKVLLIAADVYRPAAIEQLKVLGESIDVEVYTEEGSKDPISIVKHGIDSAKAKGKNLVIIDTAGRLAIDEEMMQEIEGIKKSSKPHETLFVVDSMTGQDAVNTAKTFNERLDFDGVVLTKLDGDTRGGAALSIRYVVNKPIKFVGIGEKLDALDEFYPDRMSQRILGMGDIVTLVEKAQEQFDEKESEKLRRKISKDQFNYNDFLKQLGQVKKMGNAKDLLGMIPGAGKAIKDIDFDDDSFGKIEAIIYSMTPTEREDPALMNGTRRKRIASGSGHDIQEVNQFIKQFESMRKMMKTMGKMNKMGRAMQNLPFNNK